MALARSTGLGNSVTMMATITEDDSAPPMPWTKRAATSMAWLSADPQAMEARVKSATPARNTFLRPIEVAQAAGHQEEAAEGDEVGVDHPGQAGLREVEALLDVGQGHVDDGAVQGVHEHGQADDDEGDPAPAVAGGVLGAEAGHGHRSGVGDSHDLGTIIGG